MTITWLACLVALTMILVVGVIALTLLAVSTRATESRFVRMHGRAREAVRGPGPN